jgi:hypothetical protein
MVERVARDVIVGFYVLCDFELAYRSNNAKVKAESQQYQREGEGGFATISPYVREEDGREGRFDALATAITQARSFPLSSTSFGSSAVSSKQQSQSQSQSQSRLSPHA